MKIPYPDNPEHVDNLASIELLEAQGFEGNDKCLAISVFEYGFCWRDLGDSFLLIYGIKGDCTKGEFIRFDRSTLDKNLDPYKEWNWIRDWEQEVSCYSDMSLDDFMKQKLPFIVTHLLQVYGYENIFGSSYWEGFEIKK